MCTYAKVARGVNVKLGLWQKRLWYEVENSSSELSRFESVCYKINDIPDMEWKDFLRAVDALFLKNGFERIAK